jgi:hypothetical protein
MFDFTYPIRLLENLSVRKKKAKRIKNDKKKKEKYVSNCERRVKNFKHETM